MTAHPVGRALVAGTQAMVERSRLACTAATDAGLPGSFRLASSGALTAVLVSARGLEFLNAVHGVDERSVDDLPRLLAEFERAGAPPPSLVGGSVTAALQRRLEELDYRPVAPAPLAVKDLRAADDASLPRTPDLPVASVPGPMTGLFRDVLLRGYDAVPAVSSFMAAEHASPGVRRCLAWHGDEPVAAAALSLHGNVAVLGGAATLPPWRGTGAQLALLRHRLQVARAAGAGIAAATAAPGSPSARNLVRAGFDVVDRHRWSRTG